MPIKPIEYKSDQHHVNTTTNVLETKTNSGITCVWSGKVNTSLQIDFTWKFDWNELKNEGVDEITGHINVSSNNNWFTPTKIDVKLTEDNQEITKQVGSGYIAYNAYYEYSLIPQYSPLHEKPSYEEMFAPSDQNDTILVVDGKKLHVNKTFLSYHSEFFRALFSSNFKEGQMDEIPIGDVSFDDFAFFLSTIYPTQAFPTDKTVEKLLEMARRFLVSCATRSAEYHLMKNSKINNEKMLWLADEYGLPTLLEKCIRGLNTEEKIKKLKQSEEYKKLSDSAKVKVLDRILSQFF